MHKRIHHWLQADRFFKLIAYSATVAAFYFSLKPPSPKQPPWYLCHLRGDLLLHLIFYFGLTFSYFTALYTHKKSLLKALIYAWLLGVFLEVLQSFSFFQREFDLLDLLANSLGVLGAGVSLKKLFNYSLKY